MYKAIVGIVVKNESTYIQECILHNYIVGFDKIVIGLCNDTTDNTKEKIEQVIQKFNIDIDIIDVDVISPNPFFDLNPSIFHQQIGYRLIYDKYVGKAEWLALFDVDECFSHISGQSIKSLLDNIPNDVGQVLVPWLTFNHNNRIVSVPVNETRYSWFNNITIANIDHGWNWMQYKTEHCQCKPIVRLDNILIEQDWYHCHHVVCNKKTTDFSLREVDGSPMKLNGVPVFERNVVLVHYRSGAMEDWVNRWKRKHWANPNENYTEYDFHEFQKYTMDGQDSRMMVYHNKMMQLKSQL